MQTRRLPPALEGAVLLQDLFKNFCRLQAAALKDAVLTPLKAVFCFIVSQRCRPPLKVRCCFKICSRVRADQKCRLESCCPPLKARCYFRVRSRICAHLNRVAPSLSKRCRPRLKARCCFKICSKICEDPNLVADRPCTDRPCS